MGNQREATNRSAKMKLPRAFASRRSSAARVEETTDIMFSMSHVTTNNLLSNFFRCLGYGGSFNAIYLYNKKEILIIFRVILDGGSRGARITKTKEERIYVSANKPAARRAQRNK